MLDERITMELDVIDASRDAKEAVANEKSRQKTAERRIEQLARQRAEVDAQLTKMNKTLLKEQVIAYRTAAFLLHWSHCNNLVYSIVCLSGCRTARSKLR